MDDKLDDQPKAVKVKRVYVTPILMRLGTLAELTRSVGAIGAKDSQQTGNVKRTSM